MFWIFKKSSNRYCMFNVLSYSYVLWYRAKTKHVRRWNLKRKKLSLLRKGHVIMDFFFQNTRKQKILLCQFLTDKVINSFSVLKNIKLWVSTISEMKRKWTKAISVIQKMILKNCFYTKKSKTVSGKHRPWRKPH